MNQSALWHSPFNRDDQAQRVRQAWSATPLLHGIGSTVSRKLIGHTHLRHFNAGEHVFQEGDAGVSAAVIIDGRIAIRSGDTTIAELGPGDFFGEAALLADTPRSASAVAISEASVSFLVRFQLEEFVRHRPRAGLDIMTNLARLLVARLHQQNHLLAGDA